MTNIKEEIIELRNQGKSFKEIGSIIGSSGAGANLIFNGKSNGRDLECRRYLKHNCFSQQTPESDYWAGFIAADGNISKNKKQIEITLKSTDFQFLEDFKNWCGSQHKLRHKSYFDKKYNKTRYKISLTITSIKIAKDLQLYYNIGPCKSLILKPPIRQSLSFIGGYFMGNGGIWYNKSLDTWRCGFTGSEKILNWIYSFFKDLSNTKIRKKINCYDLHYAGNKLVPQVMKRIFDNSPFVLERKYKKYLEMLKSLKIK